ncbi:hypothetical protein [Rhodoferax sp.]|uniref:hypothetical protein n=1 Tax=Rhodoferax sp. TaxID=50421 RepID=UPI0027163E6A|nr:hypothetical protein [Rhodoferax sp.]MDO8320836.1 hypothetical protein [Rhodoferax sp.]
MNAAFDAFRKHANQNPELQRELIHIVEATQSFDLTALTALAQRENFNVTVQDAEKFIAEIAGNDDELSDFELEMVAAGAPINCGRGVKQL